jgi:deoxyribodipyrimidine photo-lyase
MSEVHYTGYMRDGMRMYWGKKVLEWSKPPNKTYET